MPDQTEQQLPKKGRRFPASFYNTTSMIGVGLAFVTLGLIIFLFLAETFSGVTHPYMGLVIWVALPPFLILGLIIAAIGALRTSRRARRGLPEGKLPHLDFNKPSHRRVFSTIVYGGMVFFTLSAFGSYQAYEYTESVEFCGKVCHNVMKPEYVAYLASPHARVACAQCHIGSGATWYVKSKLSGAYQVYSTIFNKYHRPIETPIKDLRPAKETCEQCHWPSHFYSQKLREKTYYASDDQNTRTDMSMLMKIGGGVSGSAEGIHAHMYLDHAITYVALDRERMQIPYVEARSKDGTVTIYRSTELKISDEELKKATRRVVDCIDCHNRPSHVFNPPATSVNAALKSGEIDPSIPEIKRLAVEALEGEYKTEKQALSEIEAQINKYYQETYADLAKSKAGVIAQAIKAVKKIYSQNYFPEMKVSWKGFPDNLDHINSLGCFRCHDDKHVSSTGKKISKDCNSCHTVLSQKGDDGKLMTSVNGLPFRHPVDVGDSWKEGLCRDCHAPQ